jgi:hypothetical protein
LLDKAVVVFAVGAASGELDVVLIAPCEELLVDELAAGL